MTAEGKPNCRIPEFKGMRQVLVTVPDGTSAEQVLEALKPHGGIRARELGVKRITRTKNS